MVAVSSKSLIGAEAETRRRPRRLFDVLLPRLALAPSFLITAVFVYGFIAWTFYLSLTSSKTFPSYEFVGLQSYERLWRWTFQSNPPSSWYTAIVNMGIFAALYIVFSIVIGLFLAILLDQRVRHEGIFRSIYLYPLALSFIVTGTAWKWLLDPGIGLEHTLHSWGLTSFHFDWIKNRNFVIYTVVMAGVWQASGFMMALFLAGLRGVNDDIVRAAELDGASRPTLYLRIIIPLLRPVFLSAIVVLAHNAIVSYDLVVAMTSGGPGGSAELPSTFMYSYTFTRSQMALGSASAIIMLVATAAFMVPYLVVELRARHQ